MNSFTWLGTPIADIHAWARQRGEKMVRYRAVRRDPNLFTGQIDEIESFGEAPESFWENLLFGPYTRYEELGRYDP